MLAAIMDQVNTLKSSPTQKDSPNPMYPTNVVPTNRRYPPLDVIQSTKIVGMWTLKHEIMNSSSIQNSKETLL